LSPQRLIVFDVHGGGGAVGFPSRPLLVGAFVFFVDGRGETRTVRDSLTSLLRIAGEDTLLFRQRPPRVSVIESRTARRESGIFSFTHLIVRSKRRSGNERTGNETLSSATHRVVSLLERLAGLDRSSSSLGICLLLIQKALWIGSRFVVFSCP